MGGGGGGGWVGGLRGKIGGLGGSRKVVDILLGESCEPLELLITLLISMNSNLSITFLI